MKKYIAFAAAAVLSVITPLHAAEPAQNVVEIAAGNKDFSTLVAAVKAAGLAETLSGKGPFTVFAPTDAAFAKLPKGTVESLLKPENRHPDLPRGGRQGHGCGCQTRQGEDSQR